MHLIAAVAGTSVDVVVVVQGIKPVAEAALVPVTVVEEAVGLAAVELAAAAAAAAAAKGRGFGCCCCPTVYSCR